MAHTPLGGATANVKAFGSISPLEDPILLVSILFLLIRTTDHAIGRTCDMCDPDSHSGTRTLGIHKIFVHLFLLLFQALAKKYQKSVAQIALRWNLERDTPVIPKSSKVERLKENLEVLNFKLEKEDIELINTIDKKFRTTLPSLSWGVDVYA